MDIKTLKRCKQLLDEADYILIGAGAGFSTAAGLEYGGSRFADNFQDYIERYQFTDMYTSMFYPYPTPEEQWGYFSRHIKFNRFDFEPNEVYSRLLELVQKKEYFVITTNCDGLFFKAGFASENIFATQGDYAKLQCGKACHDTLYDNQTIVEEMVRRQKDCKIPTELLPKCPVCGSMMRPHLRADNTFVENDDWEKASLKYSEFVGKLKNKRCVLIELGVGFNTPSIIRWPFEKIVGTYEKSVLVRFNKEDVEPSMEIPGESLFIKSDLCEFINALVK